MQRLQVRLMRGRVPAIFAAVMITVAVLAPHPAAAYGPAGHRIASLAAEPHLCARAVSEIARLTPAESFDELGLWADRIRGSGDFDQAAPWHYMNVEDDAVLADHEPPPQGDVLWAIERFGAELNDTRLERAERARALRFLIHFVVDLHQPLHVGRAADRGGNRIDVGYRDESANLHAFWDSDAIELSGLDIHAYAASIADDVARAFARPASTPLQWAEESLRLRGAVYDFPASGELGERYLRQAQSLTRERLVLASARLARVLNGAFCV